MVTTSNGPRSSDHAVTPADGDRALTIDARRFDAVLFDLDGVIADTDTVHVRAWTQLFDEFFRRRAPRLGEDHSPFTDADYRGYVDGRPRIDGIRNFLSSRGVTLPDQRCKDHVGNTVAALDTREQELFDGQVRTRVVTLDSAVVLVNRLKTAGIGTAVHSSSRNCRSVLEAVGLDGTFDVVMDGRDTWASGRKGNSDPAVLLEAAKRLRVRPDRCVVVEHTKSGIIAGRGSGFGMVVGVARSCHAEDLMSCGADGVINDLNELTVRPARRRMSSIPDALYSLDMLGAVLATRQTAILVDFDGTLSEIVEDPAAAAILPSAREALTALSMCCPVAVISGRDAADVKARVDVPGL